jgi:uncharacterized damage-inducible protein DinB
MNEPPANPAGPFEPPPREWNAELQAKCSATIAAGPGRLLEAVAGLDEKQLDTTYRNWTIRQIVHHMADSHMHSYIRFKWALTEDVPRIKAYDESVWAVQPEALAAPIESSLRLIEGLHGRWVAVIERMSPEHFARTFEHPEFEEIVPLWEALSYYAWHVRHHTAQIVWVRQHHGWG